MKKWIFRTAVGCAGVVLVAIAALLLFRWMNPEPKAQGRKLSEWLVQLRDSNPAKREEARLAVISMGREAIPYLTNQLTKPPNALQKAARAAFKHAPESLKVSLGRIYRPPNEVLNKHMALQAIGILGTNGAAAVPTVGEVLRQPDVALTSAAAMTLVYLGTNSLPELIAALDDGDFNIRSHACYALAMLQTNAAPAVPRLGEIVVDERGVIAATAATTLARIGEPAIPVLKDFLKHTNATVRRWGLVALGQVTPPARSTLPELMQAANDADAGVRAGAVQAVGTIDRTSAESGAVLLRALDDPNGEVRAAAAGGFTVRPRLVRENQDRLYKMLEDEAVNVRALAATAIGQTGEHAAGAVPQLTRMLDDTNEVVRASAARALLTITNSAELVKAREPERRFEMRDQ